MSDRALRAELESVQAGVSAARVDLQRKSNPELAARLVGGQEAGAALGAAVAGLEGKVNLALAAHGAARAVVDELRQQLRRREQQQVAGGALLAVALFGWFGLRTSVVHSDEAALLLAATCSASLVLGGWVGLRLLGRRVLARETSTDWPALGVALTVLTLAVSGLCVAVTLTSVQPAREALSSWWALPTGLLPLPELERSFGLPAVNSPLFWSAWPLGVTWVSTWMLVREPRESRAAGLSVGRAFALVALTVNATAAGWAAWFAGGTVFAMPQAHRFISTVLLLGLALTWTWLGVAGTLERQLWRPLQASGTAPRALALAAVISALALWAVHDALMVYAEGAQQAWRSALYETGKSEFTDVHPGWVRNFSDAWRGFADSRAPYPISTRELGWLFIEVVPSYAVAGLTCALAVVMGFNFGGRRRLLPALLRWGPFAVGAVAVVLWLIDFTGKFGRLAQR